MSECQIGYANQLFLHGLDLCLAFKEQLYFIWLFFLRRMIQHFLLLSVERITKNKVYYWWFHPHLIRSRWIPWPWIYSSDKILAGVSLLKSKYRPTLGPKVALSRLKLCSQINAYKPSDYPKRIKLNNFYIRINTTAIKGREEREGTGGPMIRTLDSRSTGLSLSP